MTSGPTRHSVILPLISLIIIMTSPTIISADKLTRKTKRDAETISIHAGYTKSDDDARLADNVRKLYEQMASDRIDKRYLSVLQPWKPLNPPDEQFEHWLKGLLEDTLGKTTAIVQRHARGSAYEKFRPWGGKRSGKNEFPKSKLKPKLKLEEAYPPFDQDRWNRVYGDYMVQMALDKLGREDVMSDKARSKKRLLDLEKIRYILQKRVDKLLVEKLKYGDTLDSLGIF